MAQRQEETVWRGFADLAMGLMAVLALILLLLLAQLRAEKEALEDAQGALRGVGEGFASDLESILGDSRTTVERQGNVFKAMRGIMRREGCRLCLADNGSLSVLPSGATSCVDRSGHNDLYDLGEVRLSKNGQLAMQSCGEAFRTIAYCLAPLQDFDEPEEDDGRHAARESRRKIVAGQCGADAAVLRARRQRCTTSLEDDKKKKLTLPTALEADIEAIVLEGNTDRVGYRRAQHIEGLDRQERRHAGATFVDNADLGAERARQALGHLLAAVAKEQETSADSASVEPAAADASDAEAVPARGDACDPVHLLMARVRVETASYGRYQAGPSRPGWRISDAKDHVLCSDLGDKSARQDGACEAARSLKLRIRWRDAALRRPFRSVRTRLCGLLANPESNFFRMVRLSGGRPAKLRSKYRCCELEVPPTCPE